MGGVPRNPLSCRLHRVMVGGRGGASRAVRSRATPGNEGFSKRTGA